MSFDFCSQPRKNGLTIFQKSLLHLVVYLMKQGDHQNHLGLGQV